MENGLVPDRFYTAQNFADYLNVHKQHIYNSQQSNHTPRLPIHVPKPIKVGVRGFRWTGRQIREYQIQLAALSGVDISDGDASSTVLPAGKGKPGRPRKSAGGAA